jgi:predicted NodU family carbamoyl transferase
LEQLRTRGARLYRDEMADCSDRRLLLNNAIKTWRVPRRLSEEAFFAPAGATSALPGANLALSGGCAMNSVANGKVYCARRFENALPAATGDASGTAAVVAAKLN